eukprot:3980183-Pyramimonas_sp.AAC.1
MGPVALPDGGTLTASDKAHIKAEYNCVANTRSRRAGTRSLTVVGPPDRVSAAWDEACRRIDENGEDGGRTHAG